MALRKAVRKREAAAGFPRWRAAVEASKTQPERSYVHEWYRVHRLNGVPASVALHAAKRRAVEAEILGSPMQATLEVLRAPRWSA